MDIDFDAASIAWRANKKKMGNGWFAYKCQYTHSNGKQCSKAVESSKNTITYGLHLGWIHTSSPSNNYCKQHKKRVVHIEYD